MSQVKITKQYILGQLDENEVDLSMNQLTTVPVRELVSINHEFCFLCNPYGVL